MKRTHNYKYTSFTRSNVRELNSEHGLYMYKVIALPMSFSNAGQQKEITKEYVRWFGDFYIRKWDEHTNINVSFNRNELKIELPQTKVQTLEKSESIFNINEEGLFKVYEQMISFLPPLYVGITNDIATRFRSHTQETNEKSLMSKINGHSEIRDNEILFIWQDLDIEFVEQYLKITSEEARKTLLEDLETLFIQINNPVFNISKRN